MSELHHIYTDDPLIKYATTTIKAERTKHEIDGVLAEYECNKILWIGIPPPKEWDNTPASTRISVAFEVDEILDGQHVNVGVRVDCPTIWDRPKPKGRPPRDEQINWDVSMRAMYHFIYTHLNAAYAMQSGKAVAFLGFIQNAKGQQIKDLILPELRQYKAIASQPAEVQPQEHWTPPGENR